MGGFDFFCIIEQFRQVIKDVAAHCGIKSGMLHLVFHRLRSLQRSPQKAKAMQLFQRLSQNPDFREKQRVLKSPLLAPLKDILPTSWMSLKEVVLYSPEFAQLQYTLCLNAPMPKDTGSILSALLDKVAAADDSKEYEASSRWQHTLSSLIQCMQDKKKTPFPPSSCRSDTGNMDQPSLFHTASTPSTFELLLPLCDTSKPMDATQSSVLHLAAQKNWSESLKAVLKRPGKFIPDINGRRTETLSPPESQYEWVVIENMTPLHAAVRSRCYGCTEDLLHAGAAVNLTVDIVATEGISYVPTGLNRLGYAERDASLHGLSPLHLAAASGCVECIRLLVDAHAPINAESILADQDVSWDGSARQVKDMGNCSLECLLTGPCCSLWGWGGGIHAEGINRVVVSTARHFASAGHCFEPLPAVRTGASTCRCNFRARRCACALELGQPSQTQKLVAFQNYGFLNRS